MLGHAQAGRVPQRVGSRGVDQPDQRNAGVVERHLPAQEVDKAPDAGIVHLGDRVDDAGGYTRPSAEGGKRRDIAGERPTRERRAGHDARAGADTGVRTHHPRDDMCVGADGRRNVTQLVGQADRRREERVDRVLRHLRGPQITADRVGRERRQDRSGELRGDRIGCTDHGDVRPGEAGQRLTEPQVLRDVDDRGEWQAAVGGELFGCPHRHLGADEQRGVGGMADHRLRIVEKCPELGPAFRVDRNVMSDPDDVDVTGGGGRRGHDQSSLRLLPGEKIIETGLAQWRMTVSQPLDGVGVGVDADHPVACGGEARRGDTAEMPQPHDGDPERAHLAVSVLADSDGARPRWATIRWAATRTAVSELCRGCHPSARTVPTSRLTTG